MVTDYGGLPADWKQFKEISQKYNIHLINDNCHALGSKYKKDRSYQLKYADYLIQSFHAVKNITTGEGGALITNDKVVFKKYEICGNTASSLFTKLILLGIMTLKNLGIILDFLK